MTRKTGKKKRVETVAQQTKAAPGIPQTLSSAGFLSAVFARPVVITAILILLGGVIYSNTIHSPFMFDDETIVEKNPTIRDFSWYLEPSKVKTLDYLYADNADIILNFKTRYISNLSFAFNYYINKLDVAGYHIFNITVHILNAILVYMIIAMTFITPYFRNRDPGAIAVYVPAFVALLFLCHPIQTQGVTYITQRYASFAAMFYLLSMMLYIRARLRKSTQLYIVSIIVTAMSMFTKEHCFTAPLIITLYEFSFFEGDVKYRIKRLTPYLITMSIIPITLYIDGRSVTAGIGESSFTRWEYLYTQFGVVARYIKLIFFPIGQNLDHDVTIVKSFFSLAAFVPFVFLATIFAGGVYSYKLSRASSPAFRLVGFGILFFFITASVESSVFPIGVELMFEHRVYLPVMGLFLAVCAAIFTLAERAGKVRPAVTVMILMAVIFSGMAYARNAVWRSPKTLWEDAATKSPDKARPHLNLGWIYAGEGRLEDAVREYKKTLSIKPDLYMAHNDLALAYAGLGDHVSAINEYRAAIALRPDIPEIHSNLGLEYQQLGDLDTAVKEYETALKMKPVLEYTWNNLGMIHYQRKRIDDAIACFKRALEINPDYVEGVTNLGLVYLDTGKIRDAVPQFNTALKLRPDYPPALDGLRKAERRGR